MSESFDIVAIKALWWNNPVEWRRAHNPTTLARYLRVLATEVESLSHENDLTVIESGRITHQQDCPTLKARAVLQLPAQPVVAMPSRKADVEAP
jgi:hypothetical protein